MVRYDAFGDMGGRLSFSAAVIDDNGDIRRFVDVGRLSVVGNGGDDYIEIDTSITLRTSLLGGSGGGTQNAFAIGTLLLSVIPLAVIGGAILYLRRRAKAIEREANARRVAPPPGLVSRSASSQ